MTQPAGQLRRWIDAYAGIHHSMLPLITISPVAAYGLRRAVKADRLIVQGRCLGLTEEEVEGIAKPLIESAAAVSLTTAASGEPPWEEIYDALIDRAMQTRS